MRRAKGCCRKCRSGTLAVAEVLAYLSSTLFAVLKPIVQILIYFALTTSAATWALEARTKLASLRSAWGLAQVGNAIVDGATGPLIGENTALAVKSSAVIIASGWATANWIPSWCRSGKHSTFPP